MRKILSILALVLTVALCTSFAASAEVVTDTLNALGSVSADVTVDYQTSTSDTTTVVYSVDVEWKDVAFTYNAGTTKWNPEQHDYSASGNDASWIDDDGEVIVTNHSNAAVAVTVSFDSAANGTASVDVANGTFTLESAVGKDTTAADSKTATLTANGIPVSNANIGTVTVAIAAN